MIEMLNLLSASDVQELAKSMHIQAKVQSKKNLVNAMIGKTKTQRSIFSTNGDNIEKAIVRKYGFFMKLSHYFTLCLRAMLFFIISSKKLANIVSVSFDLPLWGMGFNKRSRQWTFEEIVY